jgi:signal peptidase I
MNRLISFFALILLSALYAVFAKYGKYVIESNSMSPTLKAGDSVITVQDESYNVNDMVVINVDNNLYVKRIVGIEGNIIKRDDTAIIVDDKRYNTTDFYEFSDTIQLGKGEFFVLGDNLGVSVDSRIFGVIRKDQIVAKVIYPLNVNDSY